MIFNSQVAKIVYHTLSIIADEDSHKTGLNMKCCDPDANPSLAASEYRIKLYEDIVARKAANKKRAKTDLCENLQVRQTDNNT